MPPTPNTPHFPPVPPATPPQSQPSTPPRPPAVARWSSRATITRSWRIGSIPLQSIAVGFKTLASRIAQAVARPSAARRASELEELQLVNLHSPGRKAVGLGGTQAAGKEVLQKLEKALTDNLTAMVCDPTTETVDATGICKAFEKDVFRGTDIVDQVAAPPQALQAGLPNGEGEGDKRSAAIQTYMSQLGTARFGSDPALMEAFTKIAHQGAFAPFTGKMGALLGQCKFETPVARAPAVITSIPAKRFELQASSVTKDTARLEVSMHLDASIPAISDEKGAMTHLNADASAVHFSSRLTIEIDRRKVLEPPASDRSTDRKSEAAEDTGASSERLHPSRLPRGAIRLTVTNTQVQYRLDPS